MADTRRVERWFFISVAVGGMVLFVVAFAPSFIDPSRRNTPLPLTALVATHGLLGLGWLSLFLTQATLVATGRVAVHRRVGVFGAVLAAAFVLVGALTQIEQARRGFDLSGDLERATVSRTEPRAQIANIAPLIFFIVFAVLVTAALLNRHRPAVHKRLMLLAMLGGLTVTPVVHLLGHWPSLKPVAGLIILATLLVSLSLSAVHDYVTERRVHPVSVWVAGAVLVWFVVYSVVVVPTAWFRAFTAALIR
jgi:threonine/homoserine/homoserine lactone efflux protein